MESDKIQTLELRILNLEHLFKKITSNIEKPENYFLNVEEAAHFLKTTPAGIYALAWRKKLPYVKMSRRLLFSREELLSFLNKGRVKTINNEFMEADIFTSNKVKKRLKN